MQSSPSTVTHTTEFTPSTDRQRNIGRLEDQITELAAHITAARYRFLELVREYDECQGWVGEGMRSCAHWLNWKCGISLGAAREQVRTAHAIKELPHISDAFRTGQVSYAKVRAMTRVATAGNEDVLLNIARHGTAYHVEKAVSAYRKVKRIEALEQDNARHALRSLTCFQDEDGCWVFKGRLDPEQGLLLVKALEGCMEELFEEGKEVPKDVSAETREGFEERPPIDACRADALVRLAEKAMAKRKGTLNGGDKALIHVHTNKDTLKVNGDGAEAEVEGAGRVSAETSRRLACDAGVVHWLENDQGEPLSIGRKSRTVPPAIRRALQRRDKGCRFPGCTCSRFVDAHHIRHWADGGATAMDNLVLLCRHHHRLVHEVGFNVKMLANGQAEFARPSGEPLPPCGETRFRGNVFQLMGDNAKAGLDIDASTAVPGWHGEKMDIDLVLHGLLSRG